MKIDEIARYLELPSLYQPIASQAAKYLSSAGLDKRLSLVTVNMVSDVPIPLDEKRISTRAFALRGTRLARQARLFLAMGLTAEDEIKPILLYYAIAQVFGFTVWSLVKHKTLSKSHGLLLAQDQQRTFHLSMPKKGSFNRLVDLLAVFGGEPQFANIRWDSVQGNFVDSASNQTSPHKYPFSITLETVYADFDKHVSMTLSAQRTVALDLDCYVLLFIASHFARYRPEIWKRIVDGEKKETSFLYFKTAFDNCPLLYEKAIATVFLAAHEISPKDTFNLLEYNRDAVLNIPKSQSL